MCPLPPVVTFSAEHAPDFPSTASGVARASHTDGLDLLQAPQQAGFGTGYDNSYSGGFGQQQSAAYQPAPQPAPVAHFAPQSSGSMQPGSASFSSQMGGGFAPPVPQAPAYSAQPSRVSMLTGSGNLHTRRQMDEGCDKIIGCQALPQEFRPGEGLFERCWRAAGVLKLSTLICAAVTHIDLWPYHASGIWRAACRDNGWTVALKEVRRYVVGDTVHELGWGSIQAMPQPPKPAWQPQAAPAAPAQQAQPAWQPQPAPPAAQPAPAPRAPSWQPQQAPEQQQNMFAPMHAQSSGLAPVATQQVLTPTPSSCTTLAT